MWPLRDLYELTKKIIRNADFAPPDNEVIAKLEYLDLETDDRLSTQLYAAYMKLRQ